MKQKKSQEVVNMEKYLMKNRFLHFITPLIVCILLGYLFNDLMNGIRVGVLIGIGFVIGMELVRKIGLGMKKTKEKETKRNRKEN